MKILLKYIFVFYFILNGLWAINGNNTIDSLQLSLKIAKSDIDSIDILLKLSDEWKNINPTEAIQDLKTAYDISLRNNLENSELKTMLSLSEIYWSMTDFVNALHYAEKAKEKAQILGKDKELAKAYRLIGLIFIELSNYEKSSEYFFKSLKLYENINDKEGISKLLSDIGSVNFHQSNYDKGLNYFFRSLNISKENKDETGIARGYNNVAAAYDALQEYHKAIKYFKEARAINHKLGNKLSEGINYMNLGTINLKIDSFEISKQYFDKALTIFKELKNKILQAKCYLNLSDYYIDLDDESKSLEYANKALKIGKEQDLKKIIYFASKIIHDINIDKGDTTEAYKYLLLYDNMKDSLTQMENKSELAKMELQYEFDKKTQEKRIEQQRKNLFYLIVLIFLLLGLAIIALIFIRQRIKAKNSIIAKKKLELELEFKNKELTTNVMSLMKKNELLTKISNKLISIKNTAIKDETKSSLNKISKEIKKITEEEIFKEFQIRFNEVHGEFYKKLLEKYPDLTPNEQRLCAFLRLNMSSKEISELTGQRTSSLETARYRLRKKLGITNSKINLVSFLSKI